MTNSELAAKLDTLVREERRLSREILALIREAEKRRLHLEAGYANLYDWLTRAYGYSHGAAYRRIQAARLLDSVPEACEKLEQGRVSLSTLAQVQSSVRRAERKCGRTLPLRQELVRKVEGKTSTEAERILAEAFPEEAPRESVRAVSAEESRFTVVLGAEAVENLKRVRELLSHANPQATFAEVIAHLAKEYVDRKAPESASDKRRVTKSLRKVALRRAQGRCEFRDEKTGRVCGSRYQVELDHIQPRALGGTNAPENLRALCKQHNLFEAERKLGRDFMRQFCSRP